MRETWSGLSSVVAGCYTCEPDGSGTWYERNAQGVAARHHDATGHTTWVNSVVTVRYGDDHEHDYGGGQTALKV